MKRFPQLLPRGSIPDKTPLPLRSSPPTLMPKDAGGVKVTLPITMTTLPQQQGGTLPVFNMISYVSYPEKEKAAALTVATAAPTPGVVQRARAAPKRAPEPASGEAAPGAGVTPPKRKRGRPRKPRPEETGQPPPPAVQIAAPFSGGVIQKALPSMSSPVQPQVQAQPEVVKIVIQNQHGQVLGALPSALEAAAVVDGAGLGTSGAPENKGHSDSQPQSGRETSQNALLLHALGQPVTSGAQTWETGRAMVEVIRRAPVTRESAAPPAVLALAPSSQPEEKQGVEVTLTPARSDTEPPPASAPSGSSADSHQPSTGSQT